VVVRSGGGRRPRHTEHIRHSFDRCVPLDCAGLIEALQLLGGEVVGPFGKHDAGRDRVDNDVAREHLGQALGQTDRGGFRDGRCAAGARSASDERTEGAYSELTHVRRLDDWQEGQHG
jgi:hypothetical protein